MKNGCTKKTRVSERKRIIRLSMLLFPVAIVVIFFIQRALRIAEIQEIYKIDTPNGIESLEFIEIGGIQQAILIRGKDTNNPILLVLHGGPGYPEIAFAYDSILEDQYTVVNYDQRLAGKTFYANDIKGTMATDSMETRINDVIELSECLIKRFNRDKIVLYGGSWGTVLGINVIQKRPELYSVYIGTSQLVNARQAQEMAYNKALQMAIEAGNNNDRDALERLAPYPGNFDDLYYRRMFKMQNIAGKYLSEATLTLDAKGILEEKYPQFYSPYYTFRESLYFFNHDVSRFLGSGYSEAAARYLYDEYDMEKIGLDFKIPVVFCNGEYDWISPACLTEEIYPQITAPYKSFHIFEKTGHGIRKDDFKEIMFEEIYDFANEGNVKVSN